MFSNAQKFWGVLSDDVLDQRRGSKFWYAQQASADMRAIESRYLQSATALYTAAHELKDAHEKRLEAEAKGLWDEA